MAGLIRLDEKHQWSVAGWVFDHILRLMRQYLPEAESAKIVNLIDHAETGLKYLSLEGLSPADIRILRDALESAYRDMVARGPESLADPEFYPGFMGRFQELLAMIAHGDQT